MDKERLKLIVRNLESLVECLKSELDSDQKSHNPYNSYRQPSSHIYDYDEIFDED